MASVVRLDKLAAVYGGGHIFSVQSNETIQNGWVGVVGKLLPGEREIREFKKPEDVAIDKAYLVAEDEIIYEQYRQSQNNLKNFEIAPGKAFRVYELKENDIFSVSTDAIDALADEVEVGNKVVLQVGSHKLKEVDTVTNERFVGEIEAIEQVGVQTVVGAPGYVGGVIEFVVIRVLKN